MGEGGRGGRKGYGVFLYFFKLFRWRVLCVPETTASARSGRTIEMGGVPEMVLEDPNNAINLSSPSQLPLALKDSSVLNAIVHVYNFFPAGSPHPKQIPSSHYETTKANITPKFVT